VVCFFFSSSLVSPFSYTGCSVARQQLLATSLRLDNRAPLGAGYSCAPDLFLATCGSGGLNRMSFGAKVEFTSQLKSKGDLFFFCFITKMTKIIW
jgi:hypothetical protein